MTSAYSIRPPLQIEVSAPGEDGVEVVVQCGTGEAFPIQLGPAWTVRQVWYESLIPILTLALPVVT